MKHDLFMLTSEDKWELLEQMFSIPVEKRLEWLAKQIDKKRVEYIGSTDKSAPELATEFIKKGIKAKSYSKPPKKGASHVRKV